MLGVTAGADARCHRRGRCSLSVPSAAGTWPMADPVLGGIGWVAVPKFQDVRAVFQAGDRTSPWLRSSVAGQWLRGPMALWTVTVPVVSQWLCGRSMVMSPAQGPGGVGVPEGLRGGPPSVALQDPRGSSGPGAEVPPQGQPEAAPRPPRGRWVLTGVTRAWAEVSPSPASTEVSPLQPTPSPPLDPAPSRVPVPIPRPHPGSRPHPTSPSPRHVPVPIPCPHSHPCPHPAAPTSR